jgi:hypothetical protein
LVNDQHTTAVYKTADLASPWVSSPLVSTGSLSASAGTPISNLVSYQRVGRPRFIAGRFVLPLMMVPGNGMPMTAILTSP